MLGRSVPSGHGEDVMTTVRRVIAQVAALELAATEAKKEIKDLREGLLEMGEISIHQFATIRVKISDEVQALRFECIPTIEKGGAKLVASSGASPVELRMEIAQLVESAQRELRRELAATRADMASRASAADYNISKMKQHITSELAALHGQLTSGAGAREDRGHITKSTLQDQGDGRLPRSSSKNSLGSDSDISQSRPRSVSAERPHMTKLSPPLFRSQFRAAYADGSDRQLQDPFRGPSGSAAHDDRPRMSDALLWPLAADGGSSVTHGLLDVITEARPSMERPSTQGPTSARPSMDVPDRRSTDSVSRHVPYQSYLR